MPYKIPSLEPIAIVGSSCRFAGDTNSPSQLWDLLKSPSDLSKEVPENRFNIKAFYHPDGEYHGTTNSPKAYWLEQDHKIFDATFFNITPKEAEAIDPQQRLLLEVVYEALESAGYTLQQYAGQNVAVFAGVMTADYDTLSQRDDLTASQYYATGNARSIISNRVSYFFNFNGPSMTIDTACSSSLVAMHQAVLSIRSGESVMACVTGVNLMITPEQFIVESNLHMLSPNGHCRMWDANADGYARGEGVAALFLKPLSRALADGDRIEGIIRETGVNSDGRTKGITMPNPEAQARLINETYRRAGLNPRNAEDRCQFFEAHGTGTHAGDPREAAAIEDAFFGAVAAATTQSHTKGGDQRDDPKSSASTQSPSASSRLLVGSVKTVIGHTEGAAGLAGVLKVVQAMRHSTIPPNLHLETLNPSVEPFYANLRIPTTATPWPRVPTGQPKRASVNSFGFGGTNSHAIIEEYKPAIHDAVALNFSPRLLLPRSVSPAKVEDAVSSPVVLPLLLSGNSQKALVSVAERYLEYLTKNPTLQPEQLGWHSYARRTALPFKVAVAASTHDDLCQSLKGLIEKAGHSSAIGTRASTSDGGPKILGVFTGQGAQWATMSKGLLASSAVYRNTVRALDNVLATCPNPPQWTLEQEINAEERLSRVSIAAISQPLCTAIQIGLVDVLKSIGVSFHTVVGHSSGEMAAAYAAGRLSARDAMLISYYRGMFAHLAGGENGKKGTMIAVGLSKQDATELVARPEYRGRICIAASNAPTSVTLSGDVDAVRQVREDLTEQNVFARMLIIDTAYHSPHMEAPAVKYLEALAATRVSPPKTGNATVWVSSVYGGLDAPTIGDLEATYWKDNMVKPVLFYEALQTAIEQHGPFNFAIEVGPHPALKGPATQTMKVVNGSTTPYIGLLDRKKDDRLAFAESIGSIWTQFGPSAAQLRSYVENSSRPELVHEFLQEAPTYPWDHSQTYYRESRVAKQYHFRTDAPHELLGSRTRDDTEYELRWRNILKLDKLPWISGHDFQGQALLPASGYCVMARDAAKVVLAGRAASLIELEDLEFPSGITVDPESQGVETLFALSILPSTRENRLHSTIDATFVLTSAPADGSSTMKKNFSGKLRIVLEQPSPYALPHRAKWHAEALEVSTGGFYKMMADTGLKYAGPFKGLQTMERRFDFASTTLQKLHPEDTTSLSLSPATLDTCLQTCFATYSSPGDKALWTPFLPKTFERVRFNLAICDLKPDDDSVLTVDAFLTDAKPLTRESAASFTGDICIYNSLGQMEVQIEGLTVGSFAATRPENDYELYLTTVMDVDPEDEIVEAPNMYMDEPSLVLVESCERVASFYLNKGPARTPLRKKRSAFSLVPDYSSLAGNAMGTTQSQWPDETAESITEFIRSSPYHTALEFIQTLGNNLPDILLGMLPTIIDEAHQLVGFQEHLGRIAQQISHRYPRMNILGLTDPELGFTEPILSALKTSFLTYTVGSEEKAIAQLSHPQYREKIIVQDLDLEQDDADDKVSDYDLVILSTSVVRSQSTHRALKLLRSIMKPGAFLVLVHVSRSPLKNRIKKAAGLAGETDAMFTPPDWPDVLGECGFGLAPKNSNQFYPPGFAVTVRQADSDLKLQALQPPLEPAQQSVTENLLILGGKTEQTARVARGIFEQLSPSTQSICSADSLESIDPLAISSFTAAIFLNDLDEPILSTMTEQRLEILKSLIRPKMTILWVTLNARTGNPEQAASFGFGRTVLAETPSLVLRMLDLDTLDNAAPVIAGEFARLTLADMVTAGKTGELLWTHENEVHIENGRRLVPRVLPWTDANNRVNAPRRVVSTPVNTLEQIVEIVPLQSRDGSAFYETKVAPIDPLAVDIPGQVTIKVDYSSVDVLQLGYFYSTHVVVGRDLTQGQLVAALSNSNASYATVSANCVKALPNHPAVNSPLFTSLLVRYLISLSIADNVRDKSVLLIEPDAMLLDCTREVLYGRGISVRVLTTDVEKSQTQPGLQLLHAHSTNREIQRMFPCEGAYIFDFLPDTSKLSEVIQESMPENCEYHGRYSLLTSAHLNTLEDATIIEPLWDAGVTLALAKSAELTAAGFPGVPQMFSPTELLHKPEVTEAFQVLDWKKDRIVSYVTKPLVEEQLLRPYKTYLLVGLTRDLGQSLCRLFINHGARNIVLVSRNPNKTPKWRDELNAAGANIRIESLDVTNLDAVHAFKETLEMTMPPVAGIVNGAMVLDDRVFSQMDLNTLNRVMRPKALGSRNLDIAFDSPDMEFFIMTSSFAAIGGHPGQSNYAAANMYMNGLAASRRSRGLPGMALNIGVIYGLGFLHREKDELYAGLEREGYPPISERDVHHMFLEAIAAGRPSPYNPSSALLPGVQRPVVDITTGLSRFKFDGPNPLHWHLDPRFSHFTVTSGAGDKVGPDDVRKQSVKELLDESETVEEASSVLFSAFAAHLEGLLQLPTGSVHGENSISELGVDSLVAVDIRSWFYRSTETDVGVMKILASASINKLITDMCESLIATRKPAPATPTSETAATNVGTSQEAVPIPTPQAALPPIDTAVAPVGLASSLASSWTTASVEAATASSAAASDPSSSSPRSEKGEYFAGGKQ
ncbi:putative polyketide synthase [Coniochaeta sp. 2T2.1]|nr:putative polyketide synthase [Coniochaeta sp. 2T2.1]